MFQVDDVQSAEEKIIWNAVVDKEINKIYPRQQYLTVEHYQLALKIFLESEVAKLNKKAKPETVLQKMLCISGEARDSFLRNIKLEELRNILLKASSIETVKALLGAGIAADDLNKAVKSDEEEFFNALLANYENFDDEEKFKYKAFWTKLLEMIQDTEKPHFSIHHAILSDNLIQVKFLIAIAPESVGWIDFRSGAKNSLGVAVVRFISYMSGYEEPYGSSENIIPIILELVNAQKSTANGAFVICDDEKNNIFHFLVGIPNITKEIVQSFIRYGGDIDKRNIHGDTALHEAIRKENKALMQALLEAGASVDIPNENGETAEDLVQGKEELLEEFNRHKPISLEEALERVLLEANTVHWSGDGQQEMDYSSGDDNSSREEIYNKHRSTNSNATAVGGASDGEGNTEVIATDENPDDNSGGGDAENPSSDAGKASDSLSSDSSAEAQESTNATTNIFYGEAPKELVLRLVDTVEELSGKEAKEYEESMQELESEQDMANFTFVSKDLTELDLPEKHVDTQHVLACMICS